MMSAREKQDYYIEKLSEDMSDDNVAEFLFDIDYCQYGGDMFCPLCSCGCYKIGVFGALNDYDLAKLNKAMFRIKYFEKKSEE